MKQQFKFNPLATAILALLCSGSIQSSYADSNDSPSTLNNQQLKQQLAQANAGQAFFDQYYINKNDVSVEKRPTNPQYSNYCQGIWITPIATNTTAKAVQDSETHVSADYAHYNPNGDSVLEGNVIVDQEGRQVKAQKLTLDKTQTLASAQGNVQMAQNGLVSQSDSIDYNLRKQTGELNNSYYISELNHAHGYAQQIARSSPTQIVLENATYTTCAPTNNPDWHIKAKRIELNQDTGRGTTKDTRLYVKNVPVMVLPYYNFPIDDRRTTGLLTPSFGWSSSSGVQLGLPVYLNLAPNYDATITPRYLEEHGGMLEGKFNFKTQYYGQGSINAGYLPNDKSYSDKDRDSLAIKHYWDINPYFSTYFEYNYLSDIDYLYDLENDPNVTTDLNQKRLFQVNFARAIEGLDASLKIESYQTLDKTIKDKDKPYARLPQFLLNYKTVNPQGWQFEAHNDTAYFKKTINDGSALEDSGTRIYNSVATRYNYRTPWSFFIPEASVRSLNYFYDQDAQDNNPGGSKNKNIIVPQFTLDTGLNFEKQGKYLQTITPRLFYAYAPYKDQTDYPNFDTTTPSLSYDQLFNPYRFYGHDRLDDNNFMSLGISYSLFDQQGLERLKAAVGQSFYFSDRKVLLSSSDSVQTEKTSDPVFALSSQLSNSFTISSNIAFNGKNVSQANFQAYYLANTGQIYNLGYYKRKNTNNTQQTYDQVVASLIQPVKNDWRIIGHVQYDINNHIAREYLLGVNYDSCCWAVSVYGRSYFNDLDDIKSASTKRTNAVMAEFTLKGLGALNNRLASLLEQRITGFNKSNQTWIQP
ncbi:LPS-assembly protein LptD [Acinetobacter rathckeae]|uniref:LPS-assembly protein LptD n=1 Tax=Acinetobacter rathckeae TaxID=2605272 RepID=UPI0018A30500|nr:LPS assembly protein LptD [Acinetobacter rathckeae]MBF7687643.1 LPS-assembly protein LptD [Acinetobacter rathckeae]MBF7695045.1 LPS-assembly protein LptD [Acinetobacter rathckeae]